MPDVRPACTTISRRATVRKVPPSEVMAVGDWTIRSSTCPFDRKCSARLVTTTTLLPPLSSERERS